MKLFTFVFIFMALISCKKEEERITTCTETPILYILPEISNFKFKTGTYWVYIDSTSLKIDTIKLNAVTLDGIANNSFCKNQKYEYYAYTVSKKYNDFTSSSGDTYSLKAGVLMLNQSEEAGNNFVYDASSSKIDSMFIYDRYYKSVVKTVKDTFTLFYNTSYGLLKIETSGNKKLLKDKVIVR